ncbi:uncharacterized protein PV09_08014 [Verruconis gallopava]|uniref:Anaphase-promoting complex subunit 4 WD40 domain-containing protein n=1 Tax=Verruconis gallopava TaxID=253628 RepID=A0A0D2A1F5_9PEZI|nr:uncharacterized protein PV09_08014 [Verruconis gallopava]KIW00493.1 hypothetical protein PV09_08014 [Verruconis gallopava]
MSSSQRELPEPPADAISCLDFSPHTPNRLLVSSWDKGAYLYDVAAGSRVSSVSFDAALLGICFGENDEEAFAGGLDCDVHRIDFANGSKTTLSSHSKPVRSVVYDREHKLLISASWDATLHIHNLSSSRTEQSYATVTIPSKPFAMSLSSSKLVVAMSNRTFFIYELSVLADLPLGPSDIQPWQARESSMKFMTRAVACMPDDSGYASSSIEGRVAVEWFDPSEESQKRKYAFKCHRVAEPDGTDTVYPVNALAFHPERNVFASGGGDGLVSLWDAIAKRRIKQYQKFGSSVAALAFSNDGRYLAIATSPGFEDGKEPEEMEGLVKVIVRELAPDEAKMKVKK